MGRSLLRERQHVRSRPFGDCPACGATLVASDDWLDAERVVTEHLRTCEHDAAVRVARPERRPRPILRPAL
jgi:hypothetical protein